MALNLTRRLCFQRSFFHLPRFYPRTHPTRHFTKTTKRAIDDVFAEAAIPKSEGTRVLSHLERLTAIETEVAIHRKAITDGFTEIKGWIKTIVTYGSGTIFFGFGSLAYKVMVYDVNANKEIMAYTARVVHESEEKLQTRFDSRLDNLEQKTQAQIDNLDQKMQAQFEKVQAQFEKVQAQFENSKLETKSEIDKLGHLVELSTKKR